MDRREFTQNIVNNLKQKITEFRGRKKQEQMERRNELDFEINKDLVNKFKKRHSGNTEININQRLNEEKRNLGIVPNQIPETDKKSFKTTNYNESKKNQSNNNLTSNLNMKNLLENKGNLKNFLNNINNPTPERENNSNNNNNDLNFNFIHKSRTENYVPNLTNENKYNNQNDLLTFQKNSNYTINKKEIPNSDNNERGIQLNQKKERIINDLLNNNNERKSNIKRSTSPNVFKVENYFSNEVSNDKFKSLASKYEENRKSKDFNIPKNYFGNNNNNTIKNKYEFSTKVSSSKNNFFNNNNNNDNLDNFADFTLKKGTNNKTKTFNLNDFNNNNNLNALNFYFPPSKNNFNDKNISNNFVFINENDIRNLSIKIKFLTKEDIKNINRI
jgi:hypothetical protein